MTILIPEKEKEAKAVVGVRKSSKLIRSLILRLKPFAIKDLVLRVVPLIIIVGVVIFFIRENPQILGLSREVPGEGELNEEEIKSLVEEVSEIIELPQGEIPTIATVTDLSKVKDREFFEKAKNGDTVLIYREAKKAYLYRASEKKIIEVGVVTIEEESQSPEESLESIESSSTSPTPTPTQSANLTPTAFPVVTAVPRSVNISPTAAPTVLVTPVPTSVP